MKNKTVAALLAIFLGCLGIHKFYLGKGWQGVLYLLITVFTLGIAGIIIAIISLIEGIILISMSDKEFDMKYNKQYMSANQNNYRGNYIEDIRKLHQLKEDGIITEQEFEDKKRKML
ncbi:MAG: NINE protein [Dysgonomonas mossii]|uniref:NINE protein n=1 Tax=Dysgonomonas mossii TaxID=163665 RepID=UPI001DBC9922|nr:NINE protein [Dysgonomonas mossii]MBS5798046.1 NINE protein [Dysgonomonas mossii]MBS7112542.1 NINE protein [Dysgonomonas mossii]